MASDTRKRDDVAIIMSVDDRFVLPARVVLESIRRHSPGIGGAHLVILSTRLSAKSIEALEHSASGANLRLDVQILRDVAELGDVVDWVVPSCLRLYAGEFCAGFRRALYLDSDLLVLSNIVDLLDRDLAGASAAAVVNHPPFDSVRVALRRSQREDANPDAPYFNAGVLLFDPERWLSRDIGRNSRNYLKRYPNTRLFDQDALNVALTGDWRALELEWNVPAGRLEDAPVIKGLKQMNPGLADTLRAWQAAHERAKILHFTGLPKPWDAAYPWRELAQRYPEYVPVTFGAEWPSYPPVVTAEQAGETRVREFRRV